MRRLIAIAALSASTAMVAGPAWADKIINNYYGEAPYCRDHHTRHHHDYNDHGRDRGYYHRPDYYRGGYGGHYAPDPRYYEGARYSGHYEAYPDRRGYGGYRSYTPLIGGAILGGLVGSQFGKGSGKKALTAAGVILGGSVGRDYEYRRRYDGYR